MYLGPLEPRNQKPDDGRQKADDCLMPVWSDCPVSAPQQTNKRAGEGNSEEAVLSETSNAHRDVTLLPLPVRGHWALRSVGHPKDDGTGNHLGGGSSRMTKRMEKSSDRQMVNEKTNSLPAAECSNLHSLQERKIKLNDRHLEMHPSKARDLSTA